MFNLRHLSLSRNRLTELPDDAFSEMQALERLWLYRHGTRDIAHDAFDAFGLTFLDLSDNPLRERLPDNVCAFLRGVETLRVNGVDLQAICP